MRTLRQLRRLPWSLATHVRCRPNIGAITRRNNLLRLVREVGLLCLKRAGRGREARMESLLHGLGILLRGAMLLVKFGRLELAGAVWSLGSGGNRVGYTRLLHGRPTRSSLLRLTRGGRLNRAIHLIRSRLRSTIPSRELRSLHLITTKLRSRSPRSRLKRPLLTAASANGRKAGTVRFDLLIVTASLLLLSGAAKAMAMVAWACSALSRA